MDWKLELVMLPVSDVDRAKHFYADQVGFALDHDTDVGGGVRMVQLTPPGSGCSVAFGPGLGEMEPGSVEGLTLVVDDLDVARDALAGRDVPVSGIEHFEGPTPVPGRGGPWNSFVFFTDPDGNGWVVQERPAPEGAGAR